MLVQEVIEKDIGRVGIDKFVYDQTFENSNDIFANHHHMGGTRMSEEKNEGVVDKNLKVQNVFLLLDFVYIECYIIYNIFKLSL